MALFNNVSDPCRRMSCTTNKLDPIEICNSWSTLYPLFLSWVNQFKPDLYWESNKYKRNELNWIKLHLHWNTFNCNEETAECPPTTVQNSAMTSIIDKRCMKDELVRGACEKWSWLILSWLQCGTFSQISCVKKAEGEKEDTVGESGQQLEQSCIHKEATDHSFIPMHYGRDRPSSPSSHSLSLSLWIS